MASTPFGDLGDHLAWTFGVQIRMHIQLSSMCFASKSCGGTSGIFCSFIHDWSTYGAGCAVAAAESRRKLYSHSLLQAARKISLHCVFLECMEPLPVLLCFFLCLSRPNLRSMTSLPSIFWPANIHICSAGL